MFSPSLVPIACSICSQEVVPEAEKVPGAGKDWDCRKQQTNFPSPTHTTQQ